MPNNELNPIRIAVKNGETNESNPVNVVTDAEYVKVNKDSFQGTILDYIDEFADSVSTKFNKIDNSINDSNRSSGVVYLSAGPIMDAIKQPTPAPSPIDNEDDHTLSTGYSISDVLTKGLIPIVEESYEKIKRIGTGAESSDTIKMNRDNFVSLMDDKYIKEVELFDPLAIYNRILNGDDRIHVNHITGSIIFNDNIIAGDITDEDVRPRIKNIVYTMLPFNIFCDYVKYTVTILHFVNNNIGIGFRLKMYSSRKFTNDETLEMDCTKCIESINGIYSNDYSFAIKTGKNICITVSEPGQEESSICVKASDSYVDGSRIVQFSPFPIILTPHNQYINDKDNFVERYKSGSEYNRSKESFISDLGKNIAIVSAEKDDKTGKYSICKISNNENIEIYNEFYADYDDDDKSKVCGRYSLWLPKNVKPIEMYMQVNNSAPMKLIMYSSDHNISFRVHEKKYGKMYCEDTGRVEKLYIGEFKEYLLPDMHINSNGRYYAPIDYYRYISHNNINIYITNMNIDFIDDRTDEDSIPDHL